MSAREKILDAYARLLVSEGERAATLDAVAARAEVSKGGLLYHFKDKKALVTGLLERLRELVRADVEAMRTSPEGAARYYVRTSVWEDSPLDRMLVAALQLGRDSHPEAAALLGEMHEVWWQLLTEQTGDRDIARAILLLGDGLYYSAALSSETPVSAAELERLLGVVDAMMGRG